MRTRIKFCGMTRRADVDAAIALGIDAIGLVLAPNSPRRLDPLDARALRAGLPPFVSCVVLVMDQAPADVERLCRMLRPDLLQFHGSEEIEDCVRHGLPWLKAVAMGDAGDARATLARYPSAAGFVLDSHAAGSPGGTGVCFDWSRVPRDVEQPILLAGGLDPENVYDAVRSVRPWAVDVSSGIESAPGQKDPDRMRRFVAEVRRADAAT